GAAGPHESAAKTSGAAPSLLASPPADAVVPRLDRMVIANVNLLVSVENAVTAARDAERVAARYGGFVGSSNVRDVESGREATMALRIPVPSLNDALTDLRAIGKKVSDESVTTDDVSEE